MINSRSKAPAAKPATAPVVNVSAGRPVIHIEVPPAQPPDVIVNPQIHVAVPAPVDQPAPEPWPAFPEHPKKWDIEVVQRDELGLIKRVIATAITNT